MSTSDIKKNTAINSSLVERKILRVRGHKVMIDSDLVAPHGERRYRPYVFTEQGVAMLSSVPSPTCTATSYGCCLNRLKSSSACMEMRLLGEVLA